MAQPLVELYAPASADELWFKRDLLADPETMSYNAAWGGTVEFPPELWQPYWDAWLARPEDTSRFYRYLREPETGAFVGEVAYHWDKECQVYMTSVIVLARHRGQGFGSAGLELLCAAAKERGVPALWDSIALDNPSREMFLRHGFEDRGKTAEGWQVERVL